MAAVYVSNLIVNASATFAQEFSLVESDDSGPLNLSSYTVTAQIRKHASSATKKADFTIAITNASEGKLTLSLTDTQTSSMKPGRYVYDVVTEIGGIKTRVLEGSVLVREGVTR